MFVGAVPEIMPLRTEALVATRVHGGYGLEATGEWLSVLQFVVQ
jgi:hypothetical protein